MAFVDPFLISSTDGSDLHIPIPMGDQTLLAPIFVDLRPYGIEYAVAKYPITNAIYATYLGLVTRKKLLYLGDERFSGPAHPAVGITFKDAEEYCEWMSARFSAKFDLPSASTWVRIASCNRTKTYSTPSDTCTTEYVNFGLEVGATTPVNFYPPNEFGLHDMTGNVLEWTSSIPTASEMRPEYGAMPVKSDRDLAQNRVLKGGSWAFDAFNSRISVSIIMGVFSNYYTTGFRPVIRFE